MSHTHTHLLGALAAFDLLISDELIPDGMTYHLATKASLFYSLEALKKKEDIETGMENEQSVEGAESVELELDRTLEYWEKCRQLEPKFGTKTLRIIIDTLLSRVSALFVLNNSRLCSSTHIHIFTHRDKIRKQVSY